MKLRRNVEIRLDSSGKIIMFRAQCEHQGCLRDALFESDFCWEHLQDKEKYRELILQLGKDEWKSLMGADFARANLRGVNLTEANLGGANLEEADLGGTSLAGAHLSGANLQKANLRGASLEAASLWSANLEGAHLLGANLQRTYLVGSNLIRTDLSKANLGSADLRSANLNNADLSGATLTGAKVWGMSHAGCKTRDIRAEYLNFDKDGKDSGIVHLNKEQAEEFFSSQPTIEILLQNKLPPYAIRTLIDLIDKINEQNPDWGVELRSINSSSLYSELKLKANRDEILEEVANIILSVFEKGYQQKLLEYLPERKEAGTYDLILRKLGKIEKKIENPVEQVTIIHSTGQIPININMKDVKMRDIKISGKKVKIGKIINIDVGGNLYQVSTAHGREDLVRNLIDQLDSPEIEKRIEEAEAQLKGLSTDQVKFLEEEFRQSVEKIFKEKQKEVGFFDKVKAFSQRVSESTLSGVIGNAIWHVIQNVRLPGM